MRLTTLLGTVLIGICAGIRVSGYQVPLSDKDDTRQFCSGMYGGSNAKINVTFESGSRGQVSMIIYEWGDVQYLGKVTSLDEDLPKTYICTSDAVNGGYCGSEELGNFIVNLPSNIQLNATSIWSRRVVFSSSSNKTKLNESDGFWDNPAGNPTPTDTEYASPWRRSPTPVAIYTGDENEDDWDDGTFHIMADGAETSPSTPTSSSVVKEKMVLTYQEPIVYPVLKTGYYCVAVVPLTVTDMVKRAATDVANHPAYQGTISFQNTFNGQLQAADYPKIGFYLGLMLAYLVVGAAWGYMCYQHQTDLLPIQYYISYLLGFLIIEMMANWGYYRYVNAHGMGVSTTAFLIVVTILDAGRNALSFFLLLVVSLGLSVVRETLGPVMKRCTILTGLHFVFGVLYAIGLVYLDLGSTAGVILLMFVMPLAFTLSAFLLWIMHALTGTINELKQRKQRFKLRMFRRLQFILIGAVLVIAGFFVVSTMSFSDRLDENFAPASWRWRWWLIDGYLALLYLAVFVATGYLWRPTGSNRRLAMSDELAQDEEDAEDYDLDNLEGRGQPHPLNADGVPEAPRSSRRRVGEDELVFEIGDDDDDDDGRGRTPMSKRQRPSGEGHREQHEQEGLMGGER